MSTKTIFNTVRNRGVSKELLTQKKDGIVLGIIGREVAKAISTINVESSKPRREMKKPPVFVYGRYHTLDELI